MKIAILVEDNYQVLELWYPYLRLRAEGIETFFLGSVKKEYKSKEGYPATVDVLIERTMVSDFDGVVIPGGYAPDLLRRDEKIVRYVKDMFIHARLVAAICHAGWVLVSAGVLKGKRATGFYAIKDDLINAGALYEDKDVVVDGNLITSRTPADLPAFMREVIKFLETA